MAHTTSAKLKNKLLRTSMLVAPAAIMLAFSQPALADCTITSGGGTLTTPDRDSVITCDSSAPNPFVAQQIGDGTTDATLIMEDGAILDTTGVGAPGEAIYLSKTTVIMSGSASITDTDAGSEGIEAEDDLVVTMSGTTSITSGGQAIETDFGDLTLTMSGSASLTSVSDDGIYVKDADGVITLTDNASITGSRHGVESDRGELNVTLSGNAYINSGWDGVYTDYTGNTVTLSDNAYIIAGSEGVDAWSGDVVVTMSGNSYISSTNDGVEGDLDVTVTMNDNAYIETTAGGRNGVMSDQKDVFLTMSNNTYISATGDGVHVDDGEAILTIGEGTSLTGDSDGSGSGDGINAEGGVIVNYGLIRSGDGMGGGGDNSIHLTSSTRNDDVTLGTGSNLDSPNGADFGGGHDILTLTGTNSEDEVFANVEQVEVNANSTGWTLSSVSTFDDVNVNTGLFVNNGTLTINNLVTVASGASFGGTGTITGNVTNNGIVRPGNSVGTKTITGNYTQGAGGSLAVEFDNTGTDLLDISGTATIDDAVTFSESAAGVTFNTPHTFLDAAGGITGTFSDVQTVVGTSTGLAQASVAVGATEATLTLTAGTGLSTSDENDASTNEVITMINSSSVSEAEEVADIVNAINDSGNATDALSS